MRTYIDLLESLLESDDVKAQLESQFGPEANYPLHHEKECAEDDKNCDPGPEQLGSFGDSVICTSWAEFVVAALGKRAKMYGFYCEENPAPGMEQFAEGHDFALVDGRYIVDGWIKNVIGETSRAVFDLKDPADAEFIRNYYGKPKKWKKA